MIIFLRIKEALLIAKLHPQIDCGLELNFEEAKLHPQINCGLELNIEKAKLHPQINCGLELNTEDIINQHAHSKFIFKFKKKLKWNK